MLSFHTNGTAHLPAVLTHTISSIILTVCSKFDCRQLVSCLLGFSPYQGRSGSGGREKIERCNCKSFFFKENFFVREFQVLGLNLI